VDDWLARYREFWADRVERLQKAVADANG
jgi:hypothetical protein